MISALGEESLNGVAHLPDHVRKEAELYLDRILRQVAKNLPLLQGEGSSNSH